MYFGATAPDEGREGFVDNVPQEKQVNFAAKVPRNGSEVTQREPESARAEVADGAGR